MATSNDDQRILCVGLTVVDMITVVDCFPEEDSDQRGVSFRKQRGGNASNTSTVLRRLNTPCEYLGVLPPASDPEYLWLRDDFAREGIRTDHCVSSHRPCPMASVLISRQTGSRTIVFCDNGHPELDHGQFSRAVDDRLDQFLWIHLEVRPNVEDCLKMLALVEGHRQAEAQRQAQPPHTLAPFVSVEIEKPELVRPERVMKLADVVFISKDWARSRGWTDMSAAVQGAAQWCRHHCIVVCPWAEEGAAARCDDVTMTTQAPAPGPVVDTLGAGDSFVAGFLHAQSQRHTLQQSLDFACRLAAFKCTVQGFQGLDAFCTSHTFSGTDPF